MLTLLLLCGASPLEAENLAIRGSTTMYPLLERALEVFALRSPDVAISLSGSGTATGLRALLDGLTSSHRFGFSVFASWIRQREFLCGRSGLRRSRVGV